MNPRDFSKFKKKELLGMKVAVYIGAFSKTTITLKKIVKVKKDSFQIEEDPNNRYKRVDGSILNPISGFDEYCFQVTKKEAKRIKKGKRVDLTKITKFSRTK